MLPNDSGGVVKVETKGDACCHPLEHQFFVVDKSTAQAPGGCWAFVMCLKCSLSKIVKPRP